MADPTKTKNNSLRCYPNPVRDKLNLEFVMNYNSTNKITIIDSKGKTIYNSEAYFKEGLNNFTINNIKDLADGIYLIKIESEKESLTTKFVKQ